MAKMFAYLAQWYVFLVPKQIIKAWGNVLWFNQEYFSLFFLLRTLFSPWRRQLVSYGRGFNLGRYFEALIGNLISRILGALVRASLFIAGFASQVTVVFAGPAVFVAWFLLPLILLFALYQGSWGFAFFALGTLWLVRSFWKSYKKVKPLPKTENLADFIKKTQRDLQFVYARLLLDPQEVMRLLEAGPKASLPRGQTPEEVLVNAA
ncbi:MAG: hypothetical protein HYZ69_00700, partial [Candidatus Colwellbacteria bacterium]|nr:hypothetical protein [Candidatus Colwellbacteria bacterium]